MLTLISYLFILVTAIITMLVTDDDPTYVSIYEWILFAVAFAAGVATIRKLLAMARQSGEL